MNLHSNYNVEKNFKTSNLFQYELFEDSIQDRYKIQANKVVLETINDQVVLVTFYQKQM